MQTVIKSTLMKKVLNYAIKFAEELKKSKSPERGIIITKTDDKERKNRTAEGGCKNHKT